MIPKTMIDTEARAYQVALPVFEGPLDLLLHLIERQQFDITQVSLAQVTNQYLEYLARVSERNPDQLADFLVVAAKLLLIKSRILLPQVPAPPPAGDEEDVGEDLVRQLIVYKQFKQAAGWLAEVATRGYQSYIRIAGMPTLGRTVADHLGDVTLDDLLAAVRQTLASRPPDQSIDGVVSPVAITIGQQIELIESETAHGRAVSFGHLLQRATSRLEVIVTLLAVLEMIKRLRITVRQDRLFGDIEIVRREPSVAVDPGEALPE
jgi:segregation and condensation protein A